jgi:beta-glucanase (GH16 family)
LKYLTFILPLFSMLSASCSKNNSSGKPGVSPSNLTIKAVASNDSSGNVSFSAYAANAVSYDYDFGNDISQHAADGNITYRYPFSGTYTVTVIAKSEGGESSSKSVTVNVAVALKLVWSDEFDKPGSPDPTKWGFDIGTGSGGWGNNELEYYTNRQANAIISNGTLKIFALKESYNGSSYTSARLLSNNLYSFKYGRMDVRAKLPASKGTWPAIWMLGNDLATAGWPVCGEMDIMEQSGSRKSTIYGTLHYPTQKGQYGDGDTTTVSTASAAFHIYSTLWTPSSIQLFVDGLLYYTLSNNPGLPFNQPFFIILNVAMGGNFGGTVDPAFSSDQMEVDYVRVYQ